MQIAIIELATDSTASPPHTIACEPPSLNGWESTRVATLADLLMALAPSATALIAATTTLCLKTRDGSQACMHLRKRLVHAV